MGICLAHEKPAQDNTDKVIIFNSGVGDLCINVERETNKLWK